MKYRIINNGLYYELQYQKRYFDGYLNNTFKWQTIDIYYYYSKALKEMIKLKYKY